MDASERVTSARATTRRAVELTERALAEFSGGDGDARGVIADDGRDGRDGELGELVRQLEAFAERRTGAGRALTRGGGGARNARSGDKWSVRSGESGEKMDDGENSLVGMSVLYGSTVDDGASVGDLDDVASELDFAASVDYSERPSERGNARNTDRRSEIGSVQGRISAVSDSLTTSKARLTASIASLEKEAGIADGEYDRDFEQYKDDMPVVGNTKTGQPVIDVVARGVNSLSRSNSTAFGKGKGKGADREPQTGVANIFDNIFGCCMMRDRPK